MASFLAQGGTGPPIHMLLVEDEADDQLLFCLAAQRSRLNVGVQCVMDGEEALEYLEGDGPFTDRSQYPLPQVVVVDLRMPVMDGFEFLRRLKAMPRFRLLPAVVMSGCSLGSWEQQAQALGAERCFEKPVLIKDLTRMVHEVWEVARVNARCEGVLRG